MRATNSSEPGIVSRPQGNPWPWWLVFLFTSCGVLGFLDQFHSWPDYGYFLLPLYTLIFVTAGKGTRRSLGRSIVSRTWFWVTTLAVLWLLGVYLSVQWTWITHSLRSGSSLLMAVMVSVLFAGLLWWGRDRTTAIAFRQHAFDILAGGSTLAFFLIVGVVGFSIQASHREREAAQLWISLGRPMDEFGKCFHRIEENESLRLIASDLAPFELPIYRNDRFASVNASDHLEFPDQIWELATRPEDTVASVGSVTDYFAKRRETFDRLYRDIDSHEPPRWEFRPGKMSDSSVPNLLTLRNIAWVMNADALEHVRCGDQTSAGEILAAGLHLTDGLRKHPSLDSQMFSIAMESLFMKSYVRIQDDRLPNLEKLTGRNSETLCEDLRTSIQGDAFCYAESLKQADDEKIAEIVSYQIYGSFHPLQLGPWPITFRHLPRWMTRPFLRLDAANASIWIAKVLIPTLSPNNLSKLAEERESLENLFEKYPTYAGPKFPRAWSGTIASFLLREQAELIRQFRKEVAMDQTLRTEEVASKILPGKKWTCFIDPERHSVKILMKDLPKLISDVAPDSFFLIPADGKVEWVYAAARGNSGAGSGVN